LADRRPRRSSTAPQAKLTPNNPQPPPNYQVDGLTRQLSELHAAVQLKLLRVAVRAAQLGGDPAEQERVRRLGLVTKAEVSPVGWLLMLVLNIKCLLRSSSRLDRRPLSTTANCKQKQTELVEQQLNSRLQQAKERLALARWIQTLKTNIRSAGSSLAASRDPAASNAVVVAAAAPVGSASAGQDERVREQQQQQQQQQQQRLSRCDSLEEQEARVAELQRRVLLRTRDARKRLLADQEKELLRQLERLDRRPGEGDEGADDDGGVRAAAAGKVRPRWLQQQQQQHQQQEEEEEQARAEAAEAARQAAAAAATASAAAAAESASSSAAADRPEQQDSPGSWNWRPWNKQPASGSSSKAAAAAPSPSASPARTLGRQLSDRSRLWGEMVEELQELFRRRRAAGSGADEPPSAAAAAAAESPEACGALLARAVDAGALDDLVSEAAEAAKAQARVPVRASADWQQWRRQWRPPQQQHAPGAASPAASEKPPLPPRELGRLRQSEAAACPGSPGTQQAAVRHLRRELSDRTRLWGLMVEELQEWFEVRAARQAAGGDGTAAAADDSAATVSEPAAAAPAVAPLAVQTSPASLVNPAEAPADSPHSTAGYSSPAATTAAAAMSPATTVAVSPLPAAPPAFFDQQSSKGEPEREAEQAAASEEEEEEEGEEVEQPLAAFRADLEEAASGSSEEEIEEEIILEEVEGGETADGEEPFLAALSTVLPPAAAAAAMPAPADHQQQLEPSYTADDWEDEEEEEKEDEQEATGLQQTGSQADLTQLLSTAEGDLEEVRVAAAAAMEEEVEEEEATLPLAALEEDEEQHEEEEQEDSPRPDGHAPLSAQPWTGGSASDWSEGDLTSDASALSATAASAAPAVTDAAVAAGSDEPSGHQNQQQLAGGGGALDRLAAETFDSVLGLELQGVMDLCSRRSPAPQQREDEEEEEEAARPSLVFGSVEPSDSATAAAAAAATASGSGSGGLPSPEADLTAAFSLTSFDQANLQSDLEVCGAPAAADVTTLPQQPPADESAPPLAFGDFPAEVEEEEDEQQRQQEEDEEEPEGAGDGRGAASLTATLRRGQLSTAGGGADRELPAAGGDDEFDWELPLAAAGDADEGAASPRLSPQLEYSGPPPTGIPSGRRTPPPPPPRVDASPAHVDAYLSAVMAAWVAAHGGAAPEALPAGCEPLSLEGFLALERALEERAAPATAAAGTDSSSGGGVGDAAAEEDPEAAEAVAAVAAVVDDAQHIFHKALYDAANEAICRMYEQLGRTEVRSEKGGWLGGWEVGVLPCAIAALLSFVYVSLSRPLTRSTHPDQTQNRRAPCGCRRTTAARPSPSPRPPRWPPRCAPTSPPGLPRASARRPAWTRWCWPRRAPRSGGGWTPKSMRRSCSLSWRRACGGTCWGRRQRCSSSWMRPRRGRWL
jgi:hypothetical protein